MAVVAWDVLIGWWALVLTAWGGRARALHRRLPVAQPHRRVGRRGAGAGQGRALVVPPLLILVALLTAVGLVVAHILGQHLDVELGLGFGSPS